MNNIKQLCDSYIEHSYRYYILGESVIPDYQFDKLCRQILEDINNVPEEYKEFIDEDAMRCGTGFHIRMHQYPDHIKQRCYE